MRSGVEVCEQDFLAETGGQDLAIVAGGYGAAGVDGLDHATRLEGGFDISLVGHCEWSDALPPASLFGTSLSSRKLRWKWIINFLQATRIRKSCSRSGIRIVNI